MTTSHSINLTGRPWLQTLTGRAWCADEPEAYVYDIEEIAHCLAGIPRFLNHTTVPGYSVAQHSVLVAEEVASMIGYDPTSSGGRHDRRLLRAALLHDAAEAFVADLPNPVKMMPELAGYRALCKRAERAIAAHFDVLNVIDHPAIKTADLVLLATEKRDLMAPEPHSWAALPLPRQARIWVMTRNDAERDFLAAWLNLQEVT
jgi:hypothetical protein